MTIYYLFGENIIMKLISSKLTSIKANKLILLLFVLSVIIRIPNIDRPISKHHEFNVAFFLIPMEIWEKEGVKTHYFIPSYTYFAENDKNISSPIGVQEGIKNGRNYYLSFPSFSYLLPYFVFQSLHLEISALNLQIFNLFLHFTLIFFLYKILLLLFREKHIALIGSALYLFAPGPLWFHGNAYTHHVLSVLFLVISLYYIVKLLQSENINKIDFLFLAVSLICLLFTEWIGFFLVFTIGVIAIFKKFNHRLFNIALMIATISAILVLAILFFQYNAFIGWQKYLSYLTNRFDVRSTISNDETSILTQIFALFKWYLISYGIWIAFIFVLFIAYFKQLAILKTIKQHWTIVLLFVLPVILYHLIFMGFTISHDYSVLIDGIPLSLFCAFLVSKSALLKKHLVTVLGLLITFSVAQYYYINRPGEFNQNGNKYAIYMNIGKSIQEHTLSNETVFIVGCNYNIPASNPQIMFYAKRNFEAINQKDEAINFLKKQKKTKGIIFYLENDRVNSIERISTELE